MIISKVINSNKVRYILVKTVANAFVYFKADVERSQILKAPLIKLLVTTLRSHTNSRVLMPGA